MTRQEVQGVLGSEVTTGYELNQEGASGSGYKPITVKNPYRCDVVHKGQREYAIDYYLVGIQHQDGNVTDEELVPFVFEGDHLVGHGWTFFNQQIKNY